MGKHLQVIAGLDKGRILPMAENDLMQIGRSKAVVLETRLRDPSVARVHCEVEVSAEYVVVIDVDSPTGTFVNGERIQRKELHHNDVVRIGDTEMRYLDEAAMPKSVATLHLPTLHETAEDTKPPAPAASQATTTVAAFSMNMPPGDDALKGLSGKTFGAYLLGQVEGSGFCGRVVRARDTRTNRIVALKVLRPDLFLKGEDILRFAEVLKPVLPLRHQHLVTRYGAGKTGPYCWLAMEFLPGKSATQLIRRMQTTGLLSWQTALRTGVQIAKALEFARHQGFIHGNLTAQDIILDGKNFDAKLNDLMLSQALRLPSAATLAEAKHSVDEFACRAPERTQWGVDVDGRADIYGLGATLYGLLTGRMPFTGDTLVELFEQIRTAPPPRPKRHQPAVPSRFEAVVLRMLAKAPEDRYSTAGELLVALETVAREEHVMINYACADPDA